MDHIRTEGRAGETDPRHAGRDVIPVNKDVETPPERGGQYGPDLRAAAQHGKTDDPAGNERVPDTENAKGGRQRKQPFRPIGLEDLPERDRQSSPDDEDADNGRAHADPTKTETEPPTLEPTATPTETPTPTDTDTTVSETPETDTDTVGAEPRDRVPNKSSN